MEGEMNRLPLLAALVSILLPATGIAAEAPLRLVAPHPAADHSPAVSPDGRWLVFASERGGSLNLYSVRLDQGDSIVPAPHAPHPARTDSPVFSPDGRYLAYVSHRRDALGDVWLGEFPNGQARSLTARGEAGANPVFSPDGERLYFRAGRLEEGLSHRVHHLATRETQAIAGEPALFPQSPPYPVRTLDVTGGAALLYSEDTNRNGGYGEGDDPVAWVWTEGEWRQASHPIRGAHSLARNPRTGDLYIAANWTGNLDIAVVNNASFAPSMDPASMAEEAENLLQGSEDALEQAITLYREAWRRSEPGEARDARAHRALQLLLRAGRYWQAREVGEGYLADGRMQEPFRGLVRTEILAAGVEGDWEESRRTGRPFRIDGEALDELTAIRDRFRGDGLDVPAAEVTLALSRYRLLEGNPTAAISSLEPITGGGTAFPPALVARAAILRGEAFRALGLGTETRESLLAIHALDVQDVAILDAAAAGLMDATLDGVPEGERQLFALRNLASQARPFPHLNARILLAEAELLSKPPLGPDIQERHRVLREAAGLVDGAPVPAVEAGTLLAEDLIRLGNLEEAIALLTDMTRRIGEAGGERRYTGFRRLRERAVSSYLERGREEILLGDWALARTTYGRLLRFNPGNIQAWRGRIQATAVREDLLEEMIGEFRGAARSRDATALDHYKHGLALSYRDPLSRHALTAVRRAAAMESSPYFALTEGFLLEQRFHRSRESGREDPRLLEEAMDVYERGLALAGDGRDRQLTADLLLNSGNASLGLGQYARAHSFYTRRAALAVSFSDLRTEMLFHWNFGLAAYRSNYSARAAREFSLALGALRRVEAAGLLDSGQVAGVRRELTGRRALALMDEAPDSPEAERLFRELAGEYPDRSLASVRMMRNAALVRENRLAAMRGDTGEREFLLETRDLIGEALAILAGGAIEDDAARSSRIGLVNITAVVSDQGGRTDAFSASEEEGILRGVLSRVLLRLGDRAGALAQLEGQAGLSPLPRNATIYRAAARSVLLHRLSGGAMRSGQWERAAGKAWEGLSLSRRELPGDEWIDFNGATLHLLRLAEIMGTPGAAPSTAPPEALWMLGAGERELAGWPLLGAAASELLVYPDPAHGRPMGSDAPTARARLLLVRILATEEAIRTDATGRPEGGLAMIRHQAEALRKSDQVAADLGELLSLSRERNATAEIRRHALLAHGAHLRLEGFLQSSESSMDGALSRALDFADRGGFAHRRWWLYTMAGLHHPEAPAQGSLLARAVEELLSSPARSLDTTERPPWELMDRAEERAVRLAIAGGDLVRAWDIVDDWRRARLAWLAESSDPEVRTPGQMAWLREAGDLRRRWVQAQRALQRSSREEDSLSLQANAGGIAVEWASHVEEGRSAAPAQANWYVPASGGFADAGQVFAAADFMELPPALLLHRRYPGGRVIVLYTLEEDLLLDDLESLPAGGELLVLGDPIEEERALHALTSRSAADGFLTLSLRPTREVRLDEGEGLPSREELAHATDVRIDAPVSLGGYRPSAWLPAGAARSLADLLAPAAEPEAVRLSTKAMPGYDASEYGMARLALLSWLGQKDLSEATLDGVTWLGRLRAPRDYPDEARLEWGGQLARWEALRNEDPSPLHEATLERIAFLAEVVDGQAPLDAIHGNLADIRGGLGRWSDAVAAQRRAAELLEARDADPSVLLAAYTRLGDAASRARDWAAAFPAYERALEIAPGQDDPASLFALRGKVADAEERRGAFPAAAAAAEENLGLIPADHHHLRAGEHLRLARIHRVYQSRYEDALSELEMARHEAARAGSEPLLFEASINTVRSYQSLALFDLAMAELDRLEEETIDLDGHAGPGRIDRRTAEILLERSNVHWLRSEYLEAFNAQQEAVPIIESNGSMTDIQIALLNASGLTSWALNDLERALRELESALELARSAGWPDLVATTSNNIGLAHRSAGDHLESIRWFTRALQTDREQENRWGEAYSLRNIGIARTLDGRADEAVEPLRLAVSLAAEIGDRVNEAKAWTALGDALLETGRLAEAETAFQTAHELAVNTPVPEMQWRALFGLGRLELARSQPREALPFLEAATDIVDGLRASIRVEEFQDGFLLDKQELYDLTVATHLDVGNEEEAFEASEKSRGRNFIDLLGNRQLSFSRDGDSADLARSRELQRRVEEAERAFGGAEGEERRRAGAELERRRQEYNDFLLSLRGRNPGLADFVRPEPVTMAEIQALLDSETALLVYHVLPEETVIFVIGPDSLDVFRVSIPERELGELVHRVRMGIQNLQNIEVDSLRLGRILVTPALESITGYRRIGIVPHRQLHLLPFAALPAGAGDFLIDRVALFHSPSASLLRHTMERRSDRRAESRVLAIGNPALPSSAMDLPFAEKEAERLPFDFRDVTVRVRSEASEDWLRSNIQDFDIVHIASHGEFVPDDPLRSALLLSPGGAESDGRLSAAEIFGLDIRADLIALSACQTGLGRITAGDEVVGLNRAFVYAGTRQLISTLWRVDDLSTALLFKYFYRGVDDEDRAEALRRAQIRLRSRPEYQHPAHWASVVLSGDWQ